MKADYTQIDADILAAIRQAPREFAHFNTTRSPIFAQAQQLAEARLTDRWGNATPGWRVIDQRLQALRRRGLIQYVRTKGWTAQ